MFNQQPQKTLGTVKYYDEVQKWPHLSCSKRGPMASVHPTVPRSLLPYDTSCCDYHLSQTQTSLPWDLLCPSGNPLSHKCLCSANPPCLWKTILEDQFPCDSGLHSLLLQENVVLKNTEQKRLIKQAWESGEIDGLQEEREREKHL